MKNSDRRARRQSHLSGIGGVSLLAFGLMTLITGCGTNPYEELLADPPKALAAGQDLFEIYSFKEAREILEPLREQSEVGSEIWQESTFLLGLCRWHITPRGEFEVNSAVALLEELIEKTPQSSLIPDALIEVGRIYEIVDYPGDSKNVPKAREYYERVIADYPDHELAAIAILRLGQTYAEEISNKESVNKAIEIVETWVNEHPESTYRSVLFRFIGETQVEILNDLENGLNNLILADESSMMPASRRGQEFLRIATIAEKLGKIDIAIKYHEFIYQKARRYSHVYLSELKVKELRGETPEPENEDSSKVTEEKVAQ